MKPIRWLQLILMLVLLAACAPTTVNGTPRPGFSFFPTPTTLPTSSVGITHAPDAEAPMHNFLEALKNGDYAMMYGLLSKDSQATVTQDVFSKKYNDALNTMSANKLDYEVLTEALSPGTAQVGFRIIYHTALVGDIQRDMVANFILEAGQWRLKWDDSLILPELAGGNILKMDYQIPARGAVRPRPVAGLDRGFGPGVAQRERGTHGPLQQPHGFGTHRRIETRRRDRAARAPGGPDCDAAPPASSELQRLLRNDVDGAKRAARAAPCGWDGALGIWQRRFGSRARDDF